MTSDAGLPNGADNASGARSTRIDLVFLAVVAAVIAAAVLFRGSVLKERPASTTNSRAAAALVQPELPVLSAPGARDDVKHDLRNIVTLQEVFFVDSNRYADDVSVLAASRGLSVTSGARFRITTSPSGWAAVAEGGRLGNATCVVWVGGVPDSIRPRTRIQHRVGLEAQQVCDGDP
jgi:hypothetical protein